MGTNWFPINFEANLNFNEQDKLFLIINNIDNKKYLFHFENYLFLNETNERINFKKCINNNDWIIKALMPYISQNGSCAYWYAVYILDGAFPLGEKAIATDAHSSYWYAENVLNGSFSLGEKAIATDAKHSYMYALNIIQGPFLEGENIMKEYLEIWKKYNLFLKVGCFL